MAEAAGRSCAAFYANLKAQLGNKSASDLLDELDSKLEGEGSLSDEEIKAYMDLITELEPEPENPAFEAFTQDYIDRGRRSVPESEPASNSGPPRGFPRYFGILVAVFAVFAAMMMFAYGEQAKNTAVNIIGDIMKTGPGESGKMVLDQAGENGFTSLEEALAAYGVDAEGIAPTWIPGEYSIDYVDVSELKRFTEVTVEYANAEKYFVIRVIAYKDAVPDIDYEIVEGTVTIEEIAGNKFVFEENNGQYRVYWEAGRCYCSIGGDLSKEDIEDMIISM